MKYLPFIWTGLWRKPIRTAFTMLCVVIAFLLFGLLQGVDAAFSRTVADEKLDRMFVEGRFPQPLPLAYRSRIAAVPGVTRVVEVSWLSGSYQDPKNGVYVTATDPAIWLAIRPEFHIPEAQVAAMKKVRIGAIISDWLATKNGWRIGDPFTLQTSTPTVKGSTNWTFEVVGIMGNPGTTNEVRQLLANFEYYDEARSTDKRTADRFLLRIDDARYSARVAQQIDRLFANSAVQTRTQSEQEQGQSAIASLGDINFFTRAVMGTVFFTLLVLTGNTMMESVRERTAELAVLQTLGFTPANVLVLVLAEALMLCVVGAMAGLALASGVFPVVRTYVGTAVLPPVVVGLGLLSAVAVAFLSALIPAWRAMRMKIVDALAIR